MTKASVALCTFNGERFLEEQLDSIAAQSRIPDEIVLCDDASDDATVDIARRYEKELPMRIIINRQRNGTTRNFSNAIEACNGDIIFLCDQDDVWEPRKVEQIMHRFSHPDRPGMVFSDAILIDQYSRSASSSLWKANRFSRRRRDRFQKDGALAHLLRSNIVTGATAAFRSEFKTMILPIPDNWVHDYWIATVIASCARLYSEPEELTRYRIHSAQQIGIEKDIFKKVFALLSKNKDLNAEYDKYAALHSRILMNSRGPITSGRSISLVTEKLEHLRRRARIVLHKDNSASAQFKEILKGNYFRFSYGWVDIISDALLAMRLGK